MDTVKKWNSSTSVVCGIGCRFRWLSRWIIWSREISHFSLRACRSKGRTHGGMEAEVTIKVSPKIPTNTLRTNTLRTNTLPINILPISTQSSLLFPSRPPITPVLISLYRLLPQGSPTSHQPTQATPRSESSPRADPFLRPSPQRIGICPLGWVLYPA